MARYTRVLKSLAHNAVGNRRIAAVGGANYYITGATLGDAPTYTLTLARSEIGVLRLWEALIIT